MLVPVTRRLTAGLTEGPLAVVVFEDDAPGLSFGLEEEKSDMGRRSPGPSLDRRDFSCLFWTARKWESSSDHFMSSRPSLERVVETFEMFLCEVHG